MSVNNIEKEIKIIEKGLEICDQALNFANKRGDLGSEMEILNNLAVVYYWKLNNQQKSIFYLEKSLKIAHFLEDTHAKSYILAHLSFHYNCIENYDLSSEYGEQALFFARQTKIKSALALVFAIRVNSYWVNGNYLKAMVWLIRSLIILPPWQNINGSFIWQRFVELLKLKITGEKA